MSGFHIRFLLIVQVMLIGCAWGSDYLVDIEGFAKEDVTDVSNEDNALALPGIRSEVATYIPRENPSSPILVFVHVYSDCFGYLPVHETQRLVIRATFPYDLLTWNDREKTKQRKIGKNYVLETATPVMPEGRSYRLFSWPHATKKLVIQAFGECGESIDLLVGRLLSSYPSAIESEEMPISAAKWAKEELLHARDQLRSKGNETRASALARIESITGKSFRIAGGNKEGENQSIETDKVLNWIEVNSNNLVWSQFLGVLKVKEGSFEGFLVAQFKCHEEAMKHGQVSPNGRYWASSGWDDTVTLADVGTGKAIWSTKCESFACREVSFSADSSLLAVGRGHSKSLTVVSIEKGDIYKEIKTGVELNGDVAFSPIENDVIDIVDSPAGLVKTDVDTGKVQQVPFERTKTTEAENVGETGIVNSLELSSDGKFAVTAGYEHSAIVWDVESGRRISTIGDASYRVGVAAYSHSRGLMATAGREAPITIWDIRKWEKVAELTQYKNRVIALKFSPNGRLLAIGMFDHPLVLIDVANGSEIFSLSAHGGVVCALSFTKDGSCLASGGQDGIARFWKTPEKYYK